MYIAETRMCIMYTFWSDIVHILYVILAPFFRFNPWLSLSDDGNYTFKFNLCEVNTKDDNCPKNAAVCRINKDGSHAISVGNQTETVATRSDSTESELTVIYHGVQCSQSPTQLYSTAIHFKCGKYLVCIIFININ